MGVRREVRDGEGLNQAVRVVKENQGRLSHHAQGLHNGHDYGKELRKPAVASILTTEQLLVALNKGTAEEKEGTMNSNWNLLAFRYPQTILLANAV